jgi:hypothetical protein
MMHLRAKRVREMVMSDGSPGPFLWVDLNCGHVTLWRRSLLVMVLFGEVLLCHPCQLERDV